jgi:glutamate 5-kinase
MEKHQFRQVQRVVVKLGSNVITAKNDLNIEVIETISDQISALIERGSAKNVLLKLFEGEQLGTYFAPRERKMASRKCWIARTVAPKGSIVIDEWAVRAVRQKGKSLLPRGTVSVAGDFEEGDAVDFKTTGNEVVGVGLVNYSSSDINLIKGLKTFQGKP